MKPGITSQAGRWYAACLYASGPGWAVVRDVAQPGTVPGGPGHYQQEPAPGRYATQEAATAAAARFNAPRLRPADCYGLLPTPADDYHPHPWDLK
ncbi:hypothetical protein [Hymenobacter psychrotolerans]|uniref:Uncharacterized protein n=1 Tax=Hymenobacter psychrotolerans DSM 18569 TaxID=1121959 RepID=A0A1M6URI2_9BACT|nr:hypothetical protein [Hymenobacter psychrotolerans]SHK71828.1 hypothetical protein SAMN02746009_01453 [Hymenobacter psychrotolerans DSM 18569]